MLVELGRHDEALACYEGLEDTRVSYSRGEALARLGRWRDATAAFEVALGVDLRDCDSLYGLAVSLARLGRFGEALVRFDEEAPSRTAILNPGSLPQKYPYDSVNLVTVSCLT